MSICTIDHLLLQNEKILLRVDINSPVVEGKILDSPRMAEAAEMIRVLLEMKARVIVIAHQGRKGDSDFLPLKQHADLLSKKIGKTIQYIDDLFGERVEYVIAGLKPGEAIMLRNVREYDDEKDVDSKNNRYHSFSTLFDAYVNDAFSVCHRKQGSIVIPPQHLESAMGNNFEKELKAVERFKEARGKGVYLIGGSKIEDYIPLFNVLKSKNNLVLASGVLANVFLVAKEIDLGYEKKWIKEKGYHKLIPQLKGVLRKYGKQIILPVDFAFGDKIRKERKLKQAPFKEKIWDVGHDTVALFKKHIDLADIIFMKGPLGYSELPLFGYGTVEILTHISKKKAFSLLGGGHLTTTIQHYHIPNHFSYISTSGGALIAAISGEKLPGLEALEKSTWKKF
ncbi:phosphoglycerate kinase [Candidatus Pacearchaeota archaeon]|nr:phosphoglycerate kinase [Candidatus Pacearchaeota archaeon]